MLTSLELKSKLQERLAELHCASCESGGQHSLGGGESVANLSGLGWGAVRDVE